jgi:DNA-binding GntR family transcriptional regulator
VRDSASHLRAYFRIGHLSEQTPGRLADSVVEHGRIIQAIGDGDPEAGARTMREHILSVQAQQLALSDSV